MKNSNEKDVRPARGNIMCLNDFFLQALGAKQDENQKQRIATSHVICPKKNCGAVLDALAMIAHMKTHQMEELKECKLKDQHDRQPYDIEVSEMWSEFDPAAASNFAADDFDIGQLEEQFAELLNFSNMHDGGEYDACDESIAQIQVVAETIS